MGWVSTVEISLLSSLFGLAISGIGLKLALPRIKARAFYELEALEAHYVEKITILANQFIADLIQDAIEHPEKLQPLIDALTAQGMKSLGIGKEKGTPSMKIGGFRIPGAIIDQFAPMLLERFAKGGAAKAAEAAVTPFG